MKWEKNLFQKVQIHLKTRIICKVYFVQKHWLCQNQGNLDLID
jgi:hypothetical protein